MKATYILIVSVLMADMLITSDAGGAKKCSKKSKKFIKKLKSENQALTEELNELKSDNQAQTKKLKELKRDNQELQSAVESLRKKLAEHAPCYSRPCLNGGTCSNEHSCQCKSGFVGETCAEENGSCDSSPCLNGGTCSNEPGGGYSCQCKSGFGGEACEENMACDSSPCVNGGTCSNEPGGGYSCQCKSGFSGETCAGGALTASSILGELDSKYQDQLNSYLAPVLQNPSRSSFVRCWHAKTDGWAASTFHDNCDDKGPTVTIIKAGKDIFGGYTDLSWFSSSCEYASSNKSFMYLLHNSFGYLPVKMQIKSEHTSSAIWSCPGYGPYFGHSDDIYIPDNAGNRDLQSSTHFGSSYAFPVEYQVFTSCTILTGRNFFTPTDIEVFYETTT